MTEELKNKWIDSLESGAYSQSYTQLKVTFEQSSDNLPVGYCCLGVLAVVAGIEIDKYGRGCVVNGTECNYRPLQNLLGQDFQLEQLWKLNDTHRATFTEIANWVKENVDV